MEESILFVMFGGVTWFFAWLIGKMGKGYLLAAPLITAMAGIGCYEGAYPPWFPGGHGIFTPNRVLGFVAYLAAGSAGYIIGLFSVLREELDDCYRRLYPPPLSPNEVIEADE